MRNLDASAAAVRKLEEDDYDCTSLNPWSGPHHQQSYGGALIR